LYLSLSLSVSGLSCYKCGGLSASARSVVDCPADQIEVETCAAAEACVTFKRLYKKASGK
jgi:hypothetical protein